MTDNGIPASLGELASKWQHLNDIQRGEAVMKLRGKTSLRALSNQLPCSASQLRNLIYAGQVPLPDRLLAGRGEISNRELVRRSKAAARARAIADQEKLDRERTKEAQKWSDAICGWLEAEGLFCSQGEAIVNEARRELFQGECAGELPQREWAKDLTVQEIILRSRPRELEIDDVSAIAWYAIWLTRWAYFSISDTVVRDRALGLALNKQTAGESATVFNRKG